MRSKKLLFCAVAVSVGGSLAWAQGAKPRLAVKTFENPANYEKSTIGNALTEIVITELGKTGKYSLIERGAVDELMKEIGFGDTDWAKSNSFAQKGNLTGAQYFLLGKVTNFSYREQAAQEQVYVDGVARYVTVYHQEADVRVDFRLVNTATGEIKLTESGAGSRANKSTTSWIGTWNLFLASASLTGEFMDSLVGRATMAAVGDVVRKLSTLAAELPVERVDPNADLIAGLAGLEGRVLGEVGPEFRIVSLGRNHGLQVGDRLKAYREEAIKNKAGKEIYRERRESGTLEIVDLSANDRAKARVLSGADASQPAAVEGTLVAVDVEYARSLRQPAQPIRAAGDGRVTPEIRPSEELEALLQRGDRYLEDQLFVQALDQFRKANTLQADNYDVLHRIATVHLLQRDFLEAETVAGKVIEMGQSLRIPVVHDHTWTGGCDGDLLISNGQLSFRPKSGDHGFQVSAPDLLGASEGASRARTSLLSGKQTVQIPWLAIHIRGADRKDKKLNLFPLGFYQLNLDRRLLVPSPEQSADTLKYVRAITRMIAKYVKRAS